MPDEDSLEQLKHEFLDIDETNLPQEWADQPRRYLDVSRLAARASAAVLAAELLVKQVEAALSFRFRKNGLPENIKQTEESLKHAIRSDPDYTAAEQKRIELYEYEQTVLGLQEAVRQRERALKWLTFFNGRVTDTDPETAKVASDIVKRQIGLLD